jgi:hypothetical protein
MVQRYDANHQLQPGPDRAKTLSIVVLSVGYVVSGSNGSADSGSSWEKKLRNLYRRSSEMSLIL